MIGCYKHLNLFHLLNYDVLIEVVILRFELDFKILFYHGGDLLEDI